ncbi:Protein Jade-1 [Schistosoma japonicum]|nr:Protein Jade-1 [Schistosoma japonicum]
MGSCDEVRKILRHWGPLYPVCDDAPPAELFDRHPLSAMMISADSECGRKDNLVHILNSWKSEWHREGVQVPVKDAKSQPRPVYKKLDISNPKRYCSRLIMPEKLRVDCIGDNYNENIQLLVDKKIKRAPYYTVDDLDYSWISTVNEERECLSQVLIEDWMLEKVISTLEYLTYVKMRERIKEIDVQSLEFDENARCDICLSFEGEDGNELVFCDGCFLCVHQACYGIIHIPEGSWMCRQCEAGVKSTTPCSLCPNTGGAMKLSDDGIRWCHVSCALWVPEVGFGDVETMEPIIKLDNIPQARRNLLCSICRSRYGAPVQCSNAKCKTAFHVTCAFQSNLVMRQELVDKDVRLVGLCWKHSRKEQQSSTHHSTSCDLASFRTPNSPIKVHDVNQPVVLTRKQRLHELECNFHNLVQESHLNIWLDNDSMKMHLGNSAVLNDTEHRRIPNDIRAAIFVYWRLKRRANFNQPLVSPIPLTWKESADEVAATTKEELARVERANSDMKAYESFKRIRFGLDRARLMADMVLQRERRKLALFKRMWRISEIQLSTLDMQKDLLPSELLHNAHIGDSVYDNWELFLAYNNPSHLHVDRGKHISSLSKSRKDLKSPSTCPVDESKTGNLKTSLPNVTTKLAESMDSFNVSAIPKECLIVPDTIKQRLRSTLTLVAENCNMWRTDKYVNGSNHKRKTNNHDIESHKSVSSFNQSIKSPSKSHCSSPLTSSTKMNKPLKNDMPVVQVKLSPISDAKPFKYCVNTLNNNSNECMPSKRRKQMNNSNSLFEKSPPSHSIPVLSKLAMITLSPRTTKIL